MDDTIAAISTPIGEGGIAIIRVSGPEALKIADAVFTLRGKSPSTLPSHTIHFGEIKKDGQLIDQAMLTVMRAPRTYTAEDTIEINCHGGMLTVRSILALCLAQGARLAEPGEFTKRAFLNGRLDLAQAEAVMDLISAKTERAHLVAANALVGHLSQKVDVERQRLITILAHIEAQIDFPEDDLAVDTRDKLIDQVDDICRSLNKLLATSKEGKILRQGISVAIIGRPNVGKSSLMNALLQQDRSIVSKIPGTTRDTIEEFSSIHGIPVRFVDTAGIRNRQGKIEAAGISRSYNALQNSDLRLLILDSSRPISDDDQRLLDICNRPRTILVENKIDLLKRLKLSGNVTLLRRIRISCTTGEGIDGLKDAIEESAYDGMNHSLNDNVVINERHHDAIRRAVDALVVGVGEMKSGNSLEVVSQSYRVALAAIGEVVGKTSSEDLLERSSVASALESSGLMYEYPKRYDVIVVGAGHAGVEAALAASRMGCETLLMTTNLDTIGQMSCNPAIGGIAKGHLAREIDALGGEMGINTDYTGIQFRMLNTKKGPSVWAPRAQCDKKEYQLRLKWVVERQVGLDVKQAMIDDLIVLSDRVCGVVTKMGVRHLGKSVIITTGTFLRGLIHVGESQIESGRAGEPAAYALSDSLKKLGFELGRLKTGTPPRLNRRSIDFSKMDLQHGDSSPCFFSYRTPRTFHVEQLPCYITYTTSKTKDVIRSNLHRSPMYSGKIQGVGPRYCPSIEDKVVKFAEKERHQIFLEPEGRSTDEFYVNGASTSLPEDVQMNMIHSIIGLEDAEIMRPAYAVEYDYSLPHQLHPTLETKVIEGLFFAGQLNGTSGYEEAGAQGLIAGINAAQKVRSEPSVILTRADSYIGVLIDDLITKSTDEPYRMFTSRAEYRLKLRQDNADLRLTPIGRKARLVTDLHWELFTQKRALIEEEIDKLRKERSGGVTFAEILRRPEVKYSTLSVANSRLPEDVQQEVEIQIKYEGYIQRDLDQIAKFNQLEEKRLPEEIDYGKITALRSESRQKLTRFRPDSIGQASRISGVTPADIAVLLVWLKKAGR